MSSRSFSSSPPPPPWQDNTRYTGFAITSIGSTAAECSKNQSRNAESDRPSFPYCQGSANELEPPVGMALNMR